MRRLMGFLFAAVLTLSVAQADTGPDADTIALIQECRCQRRVFR